MLLTDTYFVVDDLRVLEWNVGWIGEATRVTLFLVV